MFARCLSLAAFLLVVPLWATADEPKKDVKDEACKELSLKDLKLKQVEDPFAKTKPAVITSGEELAKAVADKDAQAAIMKQVDFKNQQIVCFAWSGSGQDKLTFEVKGDKKPEVIFTFTPGKTRDLRPHFHCYAIAKDATWKMAEK